MFIVCNVLIFDVYVVRCSESLREIDYTFGIFLGWKRKKRERRETGGAPWWPSGGRWRLLAFGIYVPLNVCWWSCSENPMLFGLLLMFFLWVLEYRLFDDDELASESLFSESLWFLNLSLLLWLLMLDDDELVCSLFIFVGYWSFDNDELASESSLLFCFYTLPLSLWIFWCQWW